VIEASPKAISASSENLCSQCGSLLKPNARFCNHCGHPVIEPVNQASSTVSNQSPQVKTSAMEDDYSGQPMYAESPSVPLDGPSSPQASVTEVSAASTLPKWALWGGIGIGILAIVIIGSLLIFKPFSASVPKSTSTPTSQPTKAPTENSTPVEDIDSSIASLTWEMSDNSVKVGQLLTLTLTLKNPGESPIQVIDVKLYGFYESDEILGISDASQPVSVEGGQSHKITLSLQSQEIGQRELKTAIEIEVEKDGSIYKDVILSSPLTIHVSE